MHTIISIWVLMAMAYTQTPDGCTEYCNLLLSDELHLFWRPDCVCYRQNKATKLRRHPSLDNSAIYYEPSDESPYHRTSFVDYPFYILNPMYHTQGIKKKETRKARKIAINNLDREEKLNRSFKKRISTENVLQTFDIEAEDSPLYLDIDIYKSIKNERSNNIKEHEYKQIGLTEDDLIECIDLQVLVFSRKNDPEAVTDFKDMLDETKINKYKSLTDSDLMIEIQTKCHQPIKIIDESLQQIKNSWPRKSQLRSSQDIETVKYQKNDQNKNNNVVRNVTDTSTQSYSTNEMVIDRELGNMTPNSNEKLIKTVSPLPTTIYSNVADYTNFASNFDSSNILTAKNSVIKKNIETTPEIIKSNSNAGRIGKDFKNNTVNTESKIDLRKDIFSQISNNFLTVTSEPTTMIDSSYTNFETLTKNTIISEADYITSKPIVSDQHIAMIEKDIEIPRIITKEIDNSTVVSNINGIELIPNNDFVETPIMNQDLTNEYSYETTTTFASAKPLFLYDLFKNTSKNVLDKPSLFINHNLTSKSSKDLQDDYKTHHTEEEITQDSSKFEIYNSSITNEPDLNKSIEKMLSPNNSTVKNHENNQTEIEYLVRQSGSTEIQSSNESQKISPEIITILPELRNNSSIVEFNIITTDKNENLEEVTMYPKNNFTQISYNTDKNDLKKNDHSVGKDNLINLELRDMSTMIPIETGDVRYITRQDTDTSLNFPSLNNSDKNEASQDFTTESWSFAKAQNIYIKNSTEFSTNLDKTPHLAHEIFTLNKTNNNTIPIQSKEETNYSVNQDISLTTSTVNYPITTEEIEETTQYYSGHSVSLEFVSYPSIPNTTPSKEDTTPSSQDVSPDISESTDNFILSNNITHDISYFATTDSRGSETSVISITDKTINVKKDVLFDLTSQEIVGKLYFLFGGKQVPARFVQNSDGEIKLGFDGETICNKLTQTDSNDSVILKAICNCSRSKNCTKIT